MFAFLFLWNDDDNDDDDYDDENGQDCVINILSQRQGYNQNLKWCCMQHFDLIYEELAKFRMMSCYFFFSVLDISRQVKSMVLFFFSWQ